MIDPHWFAQVVRSLGGTIEPKEAVELADSLGDLSEVLPYLAVTARAFENWPQAREALQQAAASLTRPTNMRMAHTSTMTSLPKELVAELKAALLEEHRSGNDEVDRAALPKKQLALELNRFQALRSTPDRRDPSVYIYDD